MNRMYHTTTASTMIKIVSLFAFFFLATISSAQTVRVIYYSGTVTVSSGGKSEKPRLGQQLKSSDQVKVGSGGSLQLSINGKVIQYSKAGTIKVSEAISRAGAGENSVVANSARTLAGASGAGRNTRTSVAGASRVDGKKNTMYFDSLETSALNTGSMRLNNTIASATGISNPMELLGKATELVREEALIILQPRSTAVSGGPMLFRWKRTPGVRAYRLTLIDYLGNELYSKETTDTFHVWSTPALQPEAVYSWKLADADKPKNAYRAQFHLLSGEKEGTLTEGVAAIRSELGENNPALPLMLGAFYSDNGCYGQAAELYTQGALASTDHAETYWQLVCEEYLYNMFVPVEEGYTICGGE